MSIRIFSFATSIVFAVACFGTSQLPPERRIVYSDDREYRFEVCPPLNITIGDALLLERGDFRQLAIAYPTRPPSDFLVIGRLQRLINGEYRTVWQRRLENAVSPVEICLIGNGSSVRVISVNDFFGFLDSDAAIVVYSQTGATLAKHSLRSLISRDRAGSAKEPTLGRVTIVVSRIEGHILFLEIGDRALRVDASDGRVLKNGNQQDE